MSQVFVLIQYDIDPAKREGFLGYAREMREHAREALNLDYEIHEDLEHPNRFCEMFRCETLAEYEQLDERQDDRFRELVARLERFTDLSKVGWSAVTRIP